MTLFNGVAFSGDAGKESLHDFALLLSADVAEVVADVADAVDLVLEGEGGGVDAADEGRDELGAESLKGGLEGEELSVVLDEDALVADRLVADVAQQLAVGLKLAQLGGASAEQTGPEAGEEVGVELLLGRGLADDGAGEVEEVEVDGLEERKESDAVLQLGLDAVFEDGEELGEEQLDEALLALRVAQPEDVRRERAERRGRSRGVLEDARLREHIVQVVVS